MGGGGGVMRSGLTSPRRLEPLFGGECIGGECIFITGPWLIAGGGDLLDCCDDVGLPRCCTCCCRGSDC